MSPPIRSVHVIRRVPCTSVTCLLCVSNDSQDNLGISETRTLFVLILLHNTYYSKIQKPRLIHLRVYDRRASSSKDTPSPSSLGYSLTHAHRSICHHTPPSVGTLLQIYTENPMSPPRDDKGLSDFYHNRTNSILHQLKRNFWKIAEALFRIS